MFIKYLFNWFVKFVAYISVFAYLFTYVLIIYFLLKYLFIY